ncbi:MAG: MFS transporter [Verrucomicrobia bacterium]|nr:MAG: MFS transporter [Verrucomicrobiota bacterium]TAE89306.1 MAG: MFS transporter [Verrucomicrobiota bacterium]TAF27819.1 MAG: MFS transporter [Verrucomicrobiota bacterium]TAF42668.1 MAG: MFS transporter [Verrucomicrobiota bacterium]
MNQRPKTCSTGSMFSYSLGECANSLVMNGIFGFAMLFYTKSLGLNPTLAGIAMSVSVFWEAITEPVMGHISDNTRSRWGRRHPYMLIGGLIMAICSYLIWTVPEICRGAQTDVLWYKNGVFWYLVGMNLLLRTGLTMFFIPYMALGFEMCTDYQGRSRLQGIRQILNMAANFAGPAMAWIFFFGGKDNEQATAIEANYHRMGATFAIATAVFVLLACILTFRWHDDTRDAPKNTRHGWMKEFFIEMKTILADPNPRWVFAFIFIVCAGMVIVSSLQMFVYDDFMKFPAWQKSIAHGSTMIGMALGALVSMGLTRRFDKKGAVLVGGTLSIICNLALAGLFLTDLVKPDATITIDGRSLPLGLILFVIFHAGYWFGNGIMLPVSTAMMADVSEVRRLNSGEVKDGGYSSVFSLAMRMAISFSLVLAGWCLSAIGYETPAPAAGQTSQAIWLLGLVTFVVGAVICLFSLLAIRKYPISHQALEELRARIGGKL